MNEEATERRRMPGWAKGLSLLDGTMTLAIVTALLWCGRESQRIDQMANSIIEIKATIDARVKVSDATSAEIGEVKVKVAEEKQQISDLRDFLGQRLDRIERKVDSK